MNRKKFFVTVIILNTVMLVFAACFYSLRACQTPEGEGNGPRPRVSTEANGKFGPVIEKVLPAANATRRAEILDLETCHTRLEPLAQDFGFRVDAIMASIRNGGLDISCTIWSGGAACITYNMIIVPVAGKCWNETTEEELFNNPALAPKAHAPRRQLVLGRRRPDPYVFR